MRRGAGARAYAALWRRCRIARRQSSLWRVMAADAACRAFYVVGYFHQSLVQEGETVVVFGRRRCGPNRASVEDKGRGLGYFEKGHLLTGNAQILADGRAKPGDPRAGRDDRAVKCFFVFAGTDNDFTASFVDGLDRCFFE